ncbi:MAG: hypothetical protein K0R10_1540 [Alphaproteobacteria bacterium]|jgi:hypothetical protein|nr:hypothetical protein [Alphaproteobacteria bacterium]
MSYLYFAGIPLMKGKLGYRGACYAASLGAFAFGITTTLSLA